MEFSMDMVVYIVGLAATWGAVMWRISALEKKMDKHNNLVERVAVVERDLKTAFRYIDDIREKE